jgi:GT2 family glycosyltransferase
VGGERFWIRGVTYGSFPHNTEGDPFPPLSQVRDDFAKMRDAGINTVRLYSPPSDRIADAAYEAGLLLVPDIMWGSRRCELDDPQRVRFIRAWVRQHSRRLAQHPAILMYSIGNEIPPLVVRWYGRRRIQDHLRSLYEVVKEEAPQTLVTYVSHPPTEHLDLPFLDVVSYNVFLEREGDFRAYLARLHVLAGDRPVFLAELGLDSRQHGEESQARFLARFLRASFEHGLCGVSVFAWTDDWGLFEHRVEGWGFGLTDAHRRPKPALEAVADVYRRDLYGLRDRPWPRVTVVVPTHNGARWLARCLDSLEQLRYPDYEVVVVDDGSTDATPAIATRHGVRLLRQERNGGLSRARNAGVSAATGDIVAFIDDDATADPDWLFFLVTAMERTGAVACGGPNLPPPDEGFVGQCVACAPGNPTHVLLTDDLAEHIPGCNMAFRVSALQRIGGFDPTHRAAGDDVDVCWKLQVAGERIAFSPAAVVWHKRRPTVRAFLRQQWGYGVAEADLARRYPERFNTLGYLVWRGRIYARAAPSGGGWLPLSRGRIYQGWFGGAPFQGLYPSLAPWFAGLLTGPEWLLTWGSMSLAGLLTFHRSVAAGVGLLVAGGVLGGVHVGMASLGAWQATAERKSLAPRSGAFGLVTLLHLAQPLARALGRLRGWWSARRTGPSYPPETRVYGDLARRDPWLQRLLHHAWALGWRCQPSSPWSDSDLEVLGPGPCRASLVSVTEEDLERGQYYLRFRVRVRRKPWAAVLALALLATAPIFFRIPTLLPLALPLGLACWWLLRGGKRHLEAAVSHLALECAEAEGMRRAP